MSSNDIYNRLRKIYSSFSGDHRPNALSQMCIMWPDDLPDVITDTEPMEAICLEFRIEIDEDDAVDLFDMSLGEAAKRIEELIIDADNNDTRTEDLLQDIDPDFALRILKKLWETHIPSRNRIALAIEEIKFEDKQKI